MVQMVKVDVHTKQEENSSEICKTEKVCYTAENKLIENKTWAG